MVLDYLFVKSMDNNEGNDINDVESILKHSIAALFGEGAKKGAIKYDEAVIEKLLNRLFIEETCN